MFQGNIKIILLKVNFSLVNTNIQEDIEAQMPTKEAYSEKNKLRLPVFGLSKQNVFYSKASKDVFL